MKPRKDWRSHTVSGIGLINNAVLSRFRRNAIDVDVSRVQYFVSEDLALGGFEF